MLAPPESNEDPALIKPLFFADFPAAAVNTACSFRRCDCVSPPVRILRALSSVSASKSDIANKGDPVD